MVQSDGGSIAGRCQASETQDRLRVFTEEEEEDFYEDSRRAAAVHSQGGSAAVTDFGSWQASGEDYSAQEEVAFT